MDKTQTQQEKVSIGFRIYQAIIIITQIVLNMLITYFTKTYVEVIIAMISFITFRYDFPKTYHCSSISRCMLTTSIIFWFVAILTTQINIQISIFYQVCLGVLIGFCAYVYTEFKDKTNFTTIQNKRKTIIKLLDYNTSKDNIYLYCNEHGLKEYIGDTIHTYLKYSIKDTCDKMYISDNTLKYRINKFIKSGI